MILARLTKEEQRAARHAHARSIGQHRRVLADQLLLEVRAAAALALAVKGEGRLAQPLDGLRP